MVKINLFYLIITASLLNAISGNVLANNFSDKLKSKIENALSSYYPDEFEINTTTSGKVIIQGTVNTLYDKLNIYDLISRVKGVTGIDDFLNIDTPAVPDNVIKANVEEAIKDNSVILEPDKIKVNVSEGLVLLKGTVSYHREKIMAETLASWEDGVMGIDNEIDVLSPKVERSDENIKNVLNDIVENHFPLMMGKVVIKVKHGNVTVDGEANSLWEKDNLPKEFLKVLGVKSVVENLKINPEI